MLIPTMMKNEYDGMTDEQLVDLEQWMYDCEVDETDYYDQRLSIIAELERRGFYETVR